MIIIALQLLQMITLFAPASLPQNPPKPSAPDLEIVSARWTMYVLKPGVSPQPAISSTTIQKSDNVWDPIPVQVPNPTVSSKPIERHQYNYSAELRNRGQKEIKALIWSYVFTDPVTHEELKRQRGYDALTLRTSQKKTVQIRSWSSPPRVVNASSPNAAAPFQESIMIECVMFADGSLWANPEVKARVCDNLRNYQRSDLHDLEILSNSQIASQPETPPGVTIRSVKLDTSAKVSSTGSIAAPGSNPNRLPLPTDGSAVRIERTELYVYSIEVNNEGPKAIKALAWDFVFADPATDAELLRRSFANIQQIDIGKHKTVRFTTQQSPPRTVTAEALAKKTAPFLPRATLQCVLFTDGVTWEPSNASGKPCDRLARWLEQRKTWRPGVEDLPYSPQ